jgi:hypothetical protein
MSAITLMTDFGIKDGTVGVTRQMSGENCPTTQSPTIVSNAVACLSVKAGENIEAHIPHD